MTQRVTRSLMKKIIKKASKGKQNICYTCYFEKSLVKVMGLAEDIVREGNIKFKHPLLPQGIAANVYVFEGGGSLSIVAMSQTEDKLVQELY